MKRSDLPAFAAACFATLLFSGTAGAYCRTSSCDPDSTTDAHSGAVCTPPQQDDCGAPIAWPQSCVEFSVQSDASPKRGITVADTEQVMDSAFAAWMGADCTGGGHPDIQVTEGPQVTCDMHEYNQMAGNANIILFHDDAWPYEGTPNTLALTTVTYNLDSGAIYDADMELNSADNDFTIGDTGVDFDLLSIVTHESGHFLGMAHSHDPSATMWPVYNEHTTALRHLSPDDMAGICNIYPPGPPTPNCDPTPRHGFSPLCAAQQSHGCCAVAPGSASSEPPYVPAGAALSAVLGAMILAARRRRSRWGETPHPPRPSRRR